MKRLAFLALVLCLFSKMSGQEAFSASVKPSDYLSSEVGVGGRAGLAVSPTLNFSGVMSSAGPVILSGVKSGGFGFDVMAVSYYFAYEVGFVDLGNGKWAVQLNWTSTPSQGPRRGGVTSVGFLDSTGGSIKPLNQATGGTRNGGQSTPSSGLHGVSGSGVRYIEVSIDYEYGYMGANGTYYVIAGTMTGWIAVPAAGSIDASER